MPSGALGSAGMRRSLRFSPSDRLRKRFEFRRLRDQGRRVHTRSFVLLVGQSSAPNARLGITVSRQVGKAVRRNRIKRLLREAFRQHRELLPSACDLVVIAKANCAVQSLADVRAELTQVSGALRAAWSKAPQPRTYQPRVATDSKVDAGVLAGSEATAKGKPTAQRKATAQRKPTARRKPGVPVGERS